MMNTASVTFTSITMQQGKARHYGGAIYSGGTGAASISFASCSNPVYYFESYLDGGFLYIANSQTTLSSSGCCFNHFKAVGWGGFIQGTYAGSIASTCT